MLLAPQLPPSAAPSAPPWALRFRSDDLDEVRAFNGSTDLPHSRVTRPSEALGYDFYRVLGVKTAVGCASVAAAQVVRGRVSEPVLHLAQPAGSVYRVGRQVSAPTGALSAVIVPSDWDFTRVSPPGTLLSVRLDRRALRDELASRQPAAGSDWALRLELLSLSPIEKAGLMAATADLVQATGPGIDARQLAHAEAHVVAAVADVVLRESVASPAGSLDAARAIALEDWIEAHLTSPLSLGRLCQAAGVGARCLQKTFECRRGLSPMRFVTERRVLAAYRRLSLPGPPASVTGVALELGFGHLSRFALVYRQVIGETPSQTLARRWPAGARLQAE